ncbi:PP2C family serine/threonine-protein phosphatase [Zoogloea sp.]|uniref:PP2C family protein-serine/threonine phosphatase n=1 Tax=Zoogloea sp. TaxID=49181 RepID=UPI001416D44E|nr:MAG: serine/threonine-protein phosphatase [Zoogloea sp.]
MDQPIALETAYLSKPGGRGYNEDACGFWSNDSAACWVVSDGAGGHGSGDIASRLVVSSILEAFSANPSVSSERAIELLRHANDAVIHAKQSGVTKDDMHATVALLMVDRATDSAIWGHAGDTRIYLFRDGDIAYRTRDHSLVQSFIDAGYGNVGDIRTHPQRSLLTSAIGSAETVELSVASSLVALKPGDAFLICTDGWWEYVDEAYMLSQLEAAPEAEDWLVGMARQVERVAKAENDNFSAVGVFYGDRQPTTVIRPYPVA